MDNLLSKDRPQCACSEHEKLDLRQPQSEHEKLDLRPKKELRQYWSKSVAYGEEQNPSIREGCEIS